MRSYCIVENEIRDDDGRGVQVTQDVCNRRQEHLEDLLNVRLFERLVPPHSVPRRGKKSKSTGYREVVKVKKLRYGEETLRNKVQRGTVRQRLGRIHLVSCNMDKSLE